MSNIFRNSIQIYTLKSPLIKKSQHRDSIKKQSIEKTQFPPILSVRRSSLQIYLSAKKIKQQQKIKQKTITQKILDLTKKNQLSTLDVNQDIGNHKIWNQNIYHLTEQQRQLLTSKQIRKSYQRQNQKRGLNLSNASQIINKMRKIHQKHKRQLNQVKNMRYNGCQQMMRYSQCQQKFYKDQIGYQNQKCNEFIQNATNKNYKKVFNTLQKESDLLPIQNKIFTQTQTKTKTQNQNLIELKKNVQLIQKTKNYQKKLTNQNKSQNKIQKVFLQQQTTKCQNQLQSSLIDYESQKFYYDPNDKEISNLFKRRRKIKEEKITNKKFKYRSLSSVDNLSNHNFLTKKTTLSKDSQSYDHLFQEQEQQLLRKTKLQNKRHQVQKVKSQKLAEIIQKKLKKSIQKPFKQQWNEKYQPWKQEDIILISNKYTDEQFSIQKYSQNQNRKFSEHVLS